MINYCFKSKDELLKIAVDEIIDTVGLVIDQIVRMNDPKHTFVPLTNYPVNRLIHIITLVLLVQCPMALIFGNRVMGKLGFWLMIVMICLGIILNQIARLKFPYDIQNGEK